MHDYQVDEALDKLQKDGKVIEIDGKFFSVPIAAIQHLAKRIKKLEENHAAFH